MTTIHFTVGVPPGAPIGNVDGTEGYISTYLAKNVTGYSLQNDVIFCIAPDLMAASGQSSYTVLNGIQDGFTTHQVNALEGLFSHYIEGGNTSFTTQEEVMIADWTIVNPHLHVTGVSHSILTAAHNLVVEALAGDFTIDPNLEFQTFLSNTCNQSFVNISEVPVPASFGLFMSAMVLLAAFAMKKKFSFDRFLSR